MSSAVAINVSWVAPPLSQLNITNCSAITAWVAPFLASPEPGVGWVLCPYLTAVEFVTSLVPDDWEQPSIGDAIVWYTDMHEGRYLDTKTADALVNFSIFGCGTEICSRLDWDGDSDLTGIGMMISFYVSAVFTTIYFIVLAPEVCGSFGKRPFGFSWKRYSKFVAGFEESLQGFLDATLLFAIAMLIAAMTRYASYIRRPNESPSMYALQDSVFLSAFSVLPGFVLQSLSHELRRRRIRLFMWFLVLVFAVTVDVLYNQEYLNKFNLNSGSARSFWESAQNSGQSIWISVCQSETLLDAINKTLKAGHIVMILNCTWWVYYVVASLGGQKLTPTLKKRTRLWTIWENLRLWLRLGNGVLCLAVMWVFLGLFTVYRQDVATRMSGLDGDNDWTFGQVLAVAQWVPVGIDLVVVYIYGAREGHAGKMSRKYRVVDRTESDLLRDKVGYEQTGIEEQYSTDDKLVEPHAATLAIARSESWLDA